MEDTLVQNFQQFIKQAQNKIESNKMEDTLVQNFQQFIKQAQNKIENKLQAKYEKKEQDFEQRERDLYHDEQNLEKCIEEYNTMKTRITTIVKGRSKIKLNIGGKIFTTSIHNITSDKESMFSGMFSEEFNHQPDEDGEYFIDRNPGRFDIILEHLRGHDVKTLIAQLSNEERQTLQKDVDYYNVQSLFAHFPVLKKNISNMIASGGSDKTIRVWDITSEARPVLSRYLSLLIGGASNSGLCFISP
jgi:hypothetical protein